MPTDTKRKISPSVDADLCVALQARLIGQGAAIQAIVPYIQMYQAGLSPEGRPTGVFLLLGPTGTGKTKTVEALAEVLHGTEKSVLRVDCAEFQLEHEIAKLIGAPPGYLGHRETTPMLTQQKLGAMTSSSSSLSLVLFDEIEKAAPSMTRLLLGILDKAVLRLGDNTTVNFDRTMIFLTSNLGGKAMGRALKPDFGFDSMVPRVTRPRLAAIATAAAKRKFTPEFMNRIDALVTYEPLDRAALWKILNIQVEQLQRMIADRLGERAFHLDVTRDSRLFLLRTGTSVEYGARELKRTLQRNLVHGLAAMMAGGRVAPGSTLRVDPQDDGLGLTLTLQ